MSQFKIVTVEQVLTELDKYDHSEFHVHHTWKPSHKDFTGNNYIRLCEGMRNYHVNTNGWDDIAQHITLFPDGLIVMCREFHKQPASIYGKNGTGGKYPFMVEMIGDFDKGKDVLEGNQLLSVLKIAKYFKDKGKYIRFHRENSGKTCPGSGIDKAEFMRKVDNIMAETEKVKEKFEDIKGHWAEEHIRKVLESGKMTGYPDGTFRPNAPLTRAEMAVLISQGKI